jgi:uncharacterized repeat protein (TIGR04138 family)
MKDRLFEQKIQTIVEHDPRYCAEAYEFVSNAVTYTAKMLNKSGASKHISGKELLDGVKVFAQQEYGPLAGEVLRNWGLRDGTSVGNVVFNMVNSHLLGKSDKDSLEDFRIGFDVDKDFPTAFEKKAEPSRTISPPIIA